MHIHIKKKKNNPKIKLNNADKPIIVKVIFI
jgi:hypothetical protein